PWHKPLSAVYFAYLLIAVGTYAVRAFGARHVVYAIALVVGTPLLLHSTRVSHIDPLRVYFFFLPFTCLMEFLRSKNESWLIAVAVATALALHVHAGNVLLVFYLFPVYFLLSHEAVAKRIRNCILIGSTAVILSGYQYVDNFLRYGSPLTTGYTTDGLI